MNSKDNMNKRLCSKCNTEMAIVSKYTRLMDRDEVGELSDGEEADYLAAEIGGDSSDYEITVEIYRCPECNSEEYVETI